MGFRRRHECPQVVGRVNEAQPSSYRENGKINDDVVNHLNHQIVKRGKSDWIIVKTVK